MLPLRDQHLIKEDEPLLRMPVGQRLSEARLETMCEQNKDLPGAKGCVELGSASPGGSSPGWHTRRVPIPWRGVVSNIFAS